ncbi:polysaccharide pyruvyl transferase family protein [Ensifer soli]|uniref:polysaccharide pyruvyl transferase family protein n=1 Tax=Ciceribacter sp. sgz301302 TaxID=3342379 RepID=UPI0035B73813
MYFDNSIIVLSWPRGGPVRENWGDKLNPILVQKLVSQPVVHEKDVLGWSERPVFRVIGSGLEDSKKNHVIWGMGFIDSLSKTNETPGLICAVRGPLSRNKLLNEGITCPDVYGDPAVLYPLIYNPSIEKEYDFGIVQHFREKGKIPLPILPKGTKSLIIDVCSGVNEFVNQILSCNNIISSSLHGIICAHAYGLPAYWLKASDLPIGDDFKFHDYYASIGHSDIIPSFVNNDGFFEQGEIPPLPVKPLINFDKLISCCPFMSEVNKSKWINNFKKLKYEGSSGTIFM